MKKYEDMRILISGYGSIGKRHAEVLRSIGVGEIAVSDILEKNRDDFIAAFPDCKAYSDYETALADFKCDAVFICTPTRLHLEMAEKAIEKGVHVFIEKPLCYSTAGAVELDRKAEEMGLKVMVGFCFRYHTALLQAKKLLDDGVIGRLISIRALMGEPFYMIHPEYMDMYYSKYSGTFELVHDIDLAIYFASSGIKDVKGIYGSLSEMGMESPDIVEMIIEFEKPIIANIHLDFFQYPRRRTLDLIGWDGVIQVDFASWDSAQIRYCTKKTGEWKTMEFKTERNDMFIAEDREFLDSIIKDTPVSIDIKEGVKASLAIEAIYRI